MLKTLVLRGFSPGLGEQVWSLQRCRDECIHLSTVRGIPASLRDGKASTVDAVGLLLHLFTV